MNPARPAAGQGRGKWHPSWAASPGWWLRVWLALCLGCAGLIAHGPEHEQIVLLSEQLARRPDDLAARLRRGELLRDHARVGGSNELAAAREDFARVLRKFPRHIPAQLGLARVEADAGEWTNALLRLDRVLAGSNNVAAAHLLRAQLLVKCTRPAEAVAAFDATLRLQNEPRPETFLARARAQLLADPTNLAPARAGLEAGLERLGPVPGLQLLALDLAARAGDFSNALHRLDRLAAESERPETWLNRRGDLLLRSGDSVAARQAWADALAACERLPERVRASGGVRELETELKTKLAGPLAPPVSTPDPAR